MKTVALYLRVSTVDQHPETQLHDLRAMAQQRGFQIVGEYTDRISGTKARRPGLDDLLRDARRGRFQVVLVWASDRIARSVRHFLEVLDEFNRLSIEFVSFRESIDTGGPLGRAVVIIIGAIAELERNLIIERVRAGMRRARLEGRHIGRRPIEIDRVVRPPGPHSGRQPDRHREGSPGLPSHRQSSAQTGERCRACIYIEAAQKGCRKAPRNSLNPGLRNRQFWRLTRYAFLTVDFSSQRTLRTDSLPLRIEQAFWTGRSELESSSRHQLYELRDI